LKVWKLRAYTRLVIVGFLVTVLVAVLFFLLLRQQNEKYSAFIKDSYGEYIEYLNKDTLASTARYVELSLPILHDTELLKREAGTDWFWEESARLTQMADIFNFAYIYYIEKAETGDGYNFLMSSGIERDAHPEWLGSSTWQGSPPDFVDKAWETGQMTYSSTPIANEWGTLISAVLPIINNGVVVGVLGVDYDVSVLNPLLEHQQELEKQETAMRNKLFAGYAVFCLLVILAMLTQMRLGYTYMIVPVAETEASAHTHLMLNATPLACAIFDDNLNMLDCNEMTLQLYGFEDKQVCLDHFFDYAPELQPDGAPSLDVVEREAVKVLKGPLSSSVFEWEYRATDGSPLPLEVTLVRIPWFDGYRLATYGRDMREIQEKNRLIADAENDSHAMLDANPLACSLFDENLKMIDCNFAAVRLYGFADKEDCMARFRDTSPEFQPDGQRSAQKYKELLEKGFVDGELRFAWVHLNTSGEPIPLAVNLVRLGQGGRVRLASYARDMRRENAHEAEMQRIQVELENALVQAQEGLKAKSVFLARMSHELRTPMNSVIGVAEMMLRRHYSQEISEYLTIIRQSGLSLLGIINDILDYSKIEAGQIEIKTSEYAVSSLLYDLTSTIRVRSLDKSVAFSVKADSNMPALLIGDVMHIRQIVLNLLGNAVKYTQAGYVELEVQYEETGNRLIRLIFRVRDTGIGIKETDIASVFEDFTRVEDSEHEPIEGTGLGLAIANTLCRAMGGTLSVTSQYGVGSTFTFEIVQAYPSYQKLAHIPGAYEKRILFFEGNPVNASSLRYAFTNLGVNPVGTETLEEFQRELENNIFDFVFLPAKYAADSVYALSKHGRETQMIGMVELQDYMRYVGNVRVVLRPLYCVEVANILKGIFDDVALLDNAPPLLSSPTASVLIVDDMPTNLRVSKELLSLYSITADACSSGNEAVQLVKANRYDLIFMDHMMPGIDGVKATAVIRAIGENDPYYQNLPIVILTANAIDGQKEFFLANGINDFLAKPVEIRKLTEILAKWLPKDKQIYTAPTMPVISVPAVETEILHIAGVAVADGLRNIGGSLRAYIDILRVFSANAEERAPIMEQNLRSGELSPYMVSIHALKGAAQNIGADALAEAAQELETLAEANDLLTLREKTPDFLALLNTLTRDIAEAIRSYFPNDGNHGNISLRWLQKLKLSLADMDVQSINALMLEYLDRSVAVMENEDFMDIERHILLFEYEKAIVKIDALLTAKSGSQGHGANKR
jgi:signal transduction histidine kinase/CheY-like chemotaxis protein/HPt (histidine-containing phosphotransfer) domain-containing protein